MCAGNFNYNYPASLFTYIKDLHKVLQRFTRLNVVNNIRTLSEKDFYCNWTESSPNKNLNKLLVGKNHPNWSLSLYSFLYFFLRIKAVLYCTGDSHFPNLDWQIYVPRQFHLPHNGIGFLLHFLQAQVQLLWKWDTLHKFVILQATWHCTRRDK